MAAKKKAGTKKTVVAKKEVKTTRWEAFKAKAKIAGKYLWKGVVWFCKIFAWMLYSPIRIVKILIEWIRWKRGEHGKANKKARNGKKRNGKQ